VTVAGEVKFVPVSVTVTVLPRVAEFGASDVNVGFAGAGTFTVKDCAALLPALVVTVTLCAPVDAVALITNVAVIFVPLTTVTPVAETPLPPMATAAPARKLEPVSVTETLVP
jgi:hypothetical protein